jgi:hypothetical protein
MADEERAHWHEPVARFDVTCACEHGLRGAAAILWQQLGFLAAGHIRELGADYFSPSRQVIAAYLKRTGRMEEAMEVEAIGCNEPPPAIGFARLTPAQLQGLRDSLGD